MPKSSPSSARTSSGPGRNKGVIIGVAVLVAALLLGVFSYTATKPGGKDGASDQSVADVSQDPQEGVYKELEKLARRDAGDALAQGKADAPVVMIEYADFKCGFCGKFARDTEPDLVKKYVDNGTLRIEWRNFPIFGAESEAAARAAWAAGQQDRFWQFHEAAYAKGAKEKGFGPDRLKALAEEAGVKDLDRFERDMDSEAAKKSVGKDTEEAYQLGATSTPSFLVNGRPISGAQPEEVFTQAIEQAAKTAESSSGNAKDDAKDDAKDGSK